MEDTKKKVFLLKGEENSGKTMTIRRVCAMLWKRFVLNDYSEIKKCTDAMSGQENFDFTLMFRVGGVKIGIMSRGDPPNYVLIKTLKKFINDGCDLIICAARTPGHRVNNVKRTCTGHKIVPFEINRLPESASSDAIENVINGMAQEIFDEAINFIKNYHN